MPGQPPLAPSVPGLTGAPPPRDWRAFATEESRRQGLDPELVHRIIERESAWNPRAISPKGAEGLMQLMPETARSLGVTDPFDGEQNIRAGVKYLGTLLKNRKGDVRLALADYNAGPAAVNRFGGVPPYRETQQYVTAIDQPPSVEMVGDDVELVGDDVELLEEAPAGHQAAAGATRLTPGYGAGVDFLRTLPAAAGSALSMVSKATGPVGAVVGSVLGGIGAAAGETATIGIERMASDTGLSGVPPPSPEAARNRAVMAGVTGAVGEIGGRMVGGVINKAMAPFKGAVDATGMEVQRMFPDALPNQVADSPYLDAATAVAESGVTGGGRIGARKELLANQAQQEAFGVVSRYGGPVSPETAGTLFQEALESNTGAFKSQAAKLYADVDNLSGGVKVDMTTLKEFAAEQLEKRAGVPGEVSGNRGLRMLTQVAKAGESEADNAQINELAAGLGVSPEELAKPAYAAIRSQLGIADQPMAKEMTFQQAQTFRSDLLALIRRAKSEKDDVAKGVAQQLVKRLDDAMDAAGASTPELGVAYKTANDFYRVGKQKYESELMRGLADQYPEEVVDALIKPGSTTPIREARAAVGPAAWAKVQARTADSIVTKATDDQGAILGKDLLAELRRLSPATLKEVYPNDEARALWTLGRVLERTQRTTGPVARVSVYLAQSGIILGAMRGAVSPQSLGVLLTPKVLSQILTSKTGAKWLTTGLEAPSGSKLAATAGRKVLEQLAVSATGVRDPKAPPDPAATPQSPLGAGGAPRYTGAPPPSPARP